METLTLESFNNFNQTILPTNSIFRQSDMYTEFSFIIIFKFQEIAAIINASFSNRNYIYSHNLWRLVFLLAQKNLHLNKAFVQNRKGIIKSYTMKLKNKINKNKNHNYRQQKQGFFVLTIS